MLTIVNQNLLSVKTGIIAHQCNCQGVMGAGVARQIRDHYPHVYSFYQQACRNGQFNLGTMQLIQAGASLYIANLGGQYGFGVTRCQTDYKALTQCLKQLHRASLQLNLTPYLPFGLGSGLAGGNWDIVKQLIDLHCPNAIICQL